MESGTAVNLPKSGCSQKLNDHGRRRLQVNDNSEGVTSFSGQDRRVFLLKSRLIL